MNNQLFVDNAKVLLEDMLNDHQTLVTLKKHPLSEKIARLPIERNQLGVADALHHIVFDNPTLRSWFLPPSAGEMNQLKAQLRGLRTQINA